MKRPLRSIVLPSIVALALGGCGHQQPPANGPNNGPGDMPMPPSMSDGGDAAAVTRLPEGTGGARAQETTAADSATLTASNGRGAADRETSNDVPADPAIDLSDAQILEVMRVANRVEIAQAKLAQSKAKDPQVKKLAAMMVKDHTEAEGKGAALAKNAGLIPAPSATSMFLEEDAKGATIVLKAETGADFDKGYVGAQIKEHQAVLDALGQKLLPNAKNADLKAYLTEVQGKVAAHLQQVQALQNQLDVESRAGSAGGGL